MLPERGLLIAMLAAAALSAQQPNLVTTGHHNINGTELPYTIRHLPPSSFPDLPAPVATALNRRGCLIPQSYEAHQPENVIHGSFERPDSSDWAVLCTEKDGKVSLLVFFSSDPTSPIHISGAPEDSFLQPLPDGKELGFGAAIDSASPERIHDAQIGLTPRPPRLDHDAIALSFLERKTVYRYFSNSKWTILPLPN
jgi:hypothetical protein